LWAEIAVDQRQAALSRCRNELLKEGTRLGNLVGTAQIVGLDPQRFEVSPVRKELLQSCSIQPTLPMKRCQQNGKLIDMTLLNVARQEQRFPVVVRLGHSLHGQ